jgi:hypothetical protein
MINGARFLRTAVVLLLLSPPLIAQTYELRVLNQSVSGSDFEFDIYLLRTGTTPVYLGNCDFVLTFNQGNFTSPSAETVTEGLSGWYTIDPTIISGNRYFVSLAQPPFSTQTQFDARVTNISNTYPGSLIGRFRITNVSDFGGTAGLQWRNDTPNATTISTLANTSPWAPTDITNVVSNLNPDDSPLPIQLASAAANVVRGSDVEVGWKTVSETNNYGFEVYRRRGDAGEWTKVGFVEGHGTTLAPQSYSYIDRSLSFGEYFYRIKQIDLDGKSETFPEMAVTVGAGADKFVLAQNYPNPFNPNTVIEFVVPMSGHTTLRVYNVLGQEVAKLFEGNAEAGKVNSARFDASSLPSGLYFYTLKNAAKTETKRMLLVK